METSTYKMFLNGATGDYTDAQPADEILSEGVYIEYKADFDEGQRGSWDYEEIAPSWTVYSAWLNVDGHIVEFDGPMNEYLIKKVESFLNSGLDY